MAEKFCARKIETFVGKAAAKPLEKPGFAPGKLEIPGSEFCIDNDLDVLCRRIEQSAKKLKGKRSVQRLRVSGSGEATSGSGR